MNNPDLPNDPLNLDPVDRQIRINELKAELDKMGMGPMNVSPDCPPEIHEGFLSSVQAFEKAPLSCQFDALTRDGVDLTDPASLDDASLYAKLWEVIHALAKRDVYLYHTDHFSDRELYQHLWGDSLREKNPVFPPGSGWVNHIDLIGSGSEEDIQLGLRYYDDEGSRQSWARQFPNDVIPPHEDPPYQRDDLLPKAPPPKYMEWADDGDEPTDPDE